MTRPVSRICVFLGSSAGRDPRHGETARALGAALAARGWGLVYGGGNIGLMGILADAVLGAGGEVVGVIPHALVERELAHRGVTTLRTVDTMHERKALMADLADGFVALPGGFGTLEELFEVTTWSQLGIHRKPIGLLNAGGYFDALLSFLGRAAEEGFIPPDHLRHLLIESDPGSLLDRLAAFEPLAGKVWARRRDL